MDKKITRKIKNAEELFDKLNDFRTYPTLINYLDKSANLSYRERGADYDDGIDDRRKVDRYVMRTSLDITFQGKEHTYWVYYGDQTEKIGWIRQYK